MEEVIYQFLLQTVGYPRAAIVGDATQIFPDISTDERPSFVIVDPDTAKPLAVIYVVGAVDAAGLYAASASADTLANSLPHARMQGLVVRVDFKGKSDKEKIQFYRAKEKGELYPLSASTFPDVDSLRVYSKLHERSEDVHSDYQSASTNVSSAPPVVTDTDSLASVDEASPKSKLGFWLGAVLVILAIADAVVGRVTGQPLLALPQVVLLVGAALAFLLA